MIVIIGELQEDDEKQGRVPHVCLMLSPLLIKSGFGFQFLQPPGSVTICMIPFWVRLLIRIVCALVLLVWVPFDRIQAKMKILNPGHRREHSDLPLPKKFGLFSTEPLP